MTYINTINTFYYLEDYDRTLIYYGKGLKLAEEMGDMEGRATTLHNIGVVTDIKGDFTPAEKYHIESLELRKKIGILNHISLSYSS
jgi:hypothetical protein